jgi:hypothetical protein
MVPPESLVERASVIVHARAERQVVAPGSSSRAVELAGLTINVSAEGQIEFRVVRVLKGTLSPGDTVTLKGRLESWDDLNDGPVPYTFVRRGGRQGNCFASNYRQTGDYLLLLNPSSNTDEGPWTAPIGPHSVRPTNSCAVKRTRGSFGSLSSSDDCLVALT